MGFLRSKKGSIISDYFKLLVDIGNYQAGNMYDLALFEEHLEISSPILKNKVSLNYSQITDVFYGHSGALIDKQKSVIGRAMVGGLLFGNAGAIVGGMTGMGTKKVRDSRLYLIISYISSENEERFIQFEDTRMYKGKKLSKKLKELANITEKPISDIQL